MNLKKVKYLLICIFSVMSVIIYLWGLIIKRSVWSCVIPLLIIFSALLISLASMGVYVYKTRGKLRLSRLRGIFFAIASIASLISIYYGVLINPTYRYLALALPTVIITEVFLLAFAWVGSIAIRKLHIHQERFQPLVDFDRLKSLRRNRMADIFARWMPNRVKERRRFQRLDIPLGLKYKTSDLGIWNSSFSKDISAEGIQFFACEKLTRDTPVELMMEVEDEAEPIYASGKVIWTGVDSSLATQKQLNRYRVGFKFDRVDPFRSKAVQEVFQIKNTKHINKAQILGTVLSMLCLVSSVALIWGIANHKNWVIYIPTSFFVLIILSCYFSFGSIALLPRNSK